MSTIEAELCFHSSAYFCGLVDIVHTLLCGMIKDIFEVSLSYLYFLQALACLKVISSSTNCKKISRLEPIDALK